MAYDGHGDRGSECTVSTPEEGDMGFLNRKRSPEIVIDLREQARPRQSRPAWGSPVPCPECAGRGYLDHIDPYDEVMYLHCTQCSLRYERSKADLETVDS